MHTEHSVSQLVKALLVSAALLSVTTSPVQAAAGRTTGSFDVSPTGAATYQIPIWVPPGPKGVQPDLALTYDSQSGDGTLGPGWSLSGLSAITRCNATLAQDSAAEAVALTTSDKFCLNGSKLRLTGGVYGSAGSTYQTELADFSQVTAVGAAGNGPASFTVQGKDGLIYEYGNTADSQIKATSATTPYQWLLNKVRDRAGNSYVVVYGIGDAGSQGIGVPISISYTSTTAGGSTYFYKVVFGYGPDSVAGTDSGYVAGGVVIDSNLLTSISITRVDNGTTLRKYALMYESQLSPATRKYRLASVKECSDAGLTDCLSPTTMTYQNGSSGTTNQWLFASNVTYNANYNYPAIKFDFNGDGRTDIGSYEYGNWVVRFSTGSGYSTPYNTGANTNGGFYGIARMGDVLGNGLDGILSNVGNTWWYYYWNGSTFVGVTTGAPVEAGETYLADMDGDGKADLVRYDDVSHVLAIRLNTSAGASPAFVAMPTNIEWCNDSQYPGHCALMTAATGNSSQWGGDRRKYDFNGDGREDLIWKYWDSSGYTEWGEFLSTGNSVKYVRPGLVGTYTYPHAGDYNDDGCDDIAAVWPSSSYYNQVFYSACNGSTVQTGLSLSGRPVFAVFDWNSDGRTDLLTNNYGQFGISLLIQPSLGNAFTTEFSDIIDPTGGGQVGYLFPMDADGDGLDDLGYMYYNSPSINYQLHAGAGTQPDLLKTIYDGYGNTDTVYYVSIAQSNYIKGAGAIYPEKDIQTPMMVVSQVMASDGVGGTYTQSFNYTGAREDNQGRGFLGFQSRTVTDSRANAPVVKTYYKTAFPYTGMVYQQDVYQSNGTTLISHTVNTPGLTTLDATANNQRYFPYIASSTTDTYEVGGTKNGMLIAQSSASFTYDNYGNLTNSTSTLTDKDNTAPASPTYNQTWTTTVTNTLTPNTANWCVNLPTQTTVAKSATGVTAITRTTDFTPDYVNCRMTQQVVEPSSATYKATTALGYDSFGNVNSQTVTGINMTARTTTVNWGSTGQFPISVTNALNQLTAAGYDYSKGVQTSQTDPNNLVTTWQYDSFNRKTLETRPDNTATTWSYNDCVGVSGGCQNGDPVGATSINKLVVIATLKDTGGIAMRDEWTYLDQLDRPIVTKSKTLSGADSRVGVQYDAFGRKARQTAPCDAASCAAYWNTVAYDALNRVTQTQRPISASNATLQTTTIAYQGMTMVTTDPQSKQTTKITDPNGWMRRSQDANGYYQNFTYDAFGSLKTVVDSLSNTLFSANYVYGISAFQTATTDMDLGNWNYTPNALGEVVSYTDAKGSAFTQTFDKLSRPLTRFVSGDGTTTWTWGTTASSFNIGQLQSLTNTGGTTENYTYDNKGRLSQRQIVSDATYNYDYTYSVTTGLLDTATYPTSTSSYRLALKYLYSNGLLAQVKDNAASTVFWQANAMNPRGQITQETLGNGIVTNRAYDAVTGWVNSIQSGVGGGTGVQNEAYLFDKVGNVTQRQNNTLGLTENFYYDNVYRLDYSQLNGVTNLDMTYNAMGNITNRTDVASNAAWTYHATKQHAVTQAGSASFTYTYDANGNAITRNGFTIGWNKSNYPTSIAGSGETASLYYDGNNQYWKQVYVKGATTETTLYVGAELEKVTIGSTVDWRHYIKANNQTIAIYSRQSTGTNTLRYLLEDHQGSPAKITSSTGTTTVSENFTAFGNRRNPATWSGAPTSTDLTNINAVSRQGYTGHDLLGSLGLNHMNGRVQDAITGRFLSADPYITEPDNTQNYNRYSYVLNNPMSFFDPSGFASSCVCSDSWFNNTPTLEAGITIVGGQTSLPAYNYSSLSLTFNYGSYPTFLPNINVPQLQSMTNLPMQTVTARAEKKTQTQKKSLKVYDWQIFLPGTVIFNIIGFNEENIPGLWAIDLFTPIGLGQKAARGGAEAFHYTFGKAVASIEKQGLRAGSYATPNGALKPLQAQLDLALSPNRGLTDTVLRIDLNGLRQAGYEIPGVTQVGRSFGMPGGGFEMRFPYSIPPEFISVIRP